MVLTALPETSPVEAPVEPTTPRKPSEALRLGRLLRPILMQRSFWRGEHEACTIGAILTGLGLEEEQTPLRWQGTLHRHFSRQQANYLKGVPMWLDNQASHADAVTLEAAILLDLEARGW